MQTDMAGEKTYKYDDEFKRKARKHQFEFREKVLHNTYDEKNPQVILTPEAAKQGLIFCEVYRDLIRREIKSFGTSALFSNMLRSEHIPYNIFTPMKENLYATTMLFNEIIGGGISSITDIKIEFAGKDKNKELYLNDGTSFDTYIKYISTDGEEGGIGIEVKYTERGYRIGKDEKDKINNKNSKYHLISKLCGYYKDSLDITSFIKANHLRQIWRNHILGYAMLHKGEIKRFHHIHLYPQGHEHFRDHALPEYKTILTERGKDSFIDLTYENLFELMHKYFQTPKQQEWLDYLKKRYLPL